MSQQIVKTGALGSCPDWIVSKLEMNSVMVESISLSGDTLTVDITDGSNLTTANTVIDANLGRTMMKAKRDLKDRINSHRDKLVSDYFNHDIDSVTYRFHADTRSAIRLDGLYAAATYHKTNSLPFSQDYRDYDNNTHTIDADGAIALFNSAMAHESNMVFKAVAIKDTIDATTYNSVMEIDAIDAATLWDNTVWP